MMRKLYKSFRFSQKQDRNAEQRQRSSFREQIRNEGNQTSSGAAPQNSSNRPGEATKANSNVAKPPEWEKDEELVRGSHCQFRVKYLGSKEVNDSRGMQLCDDAFEALMTRYRQQKKSGSGISSVMHIKLLKSKNNSSSLAAGGSQRPAQNAYFYISSDGLRVVDENSKSLIVDQTIEKVSFCAPVRLNPRGFAYIARDGASKRWMCHVLLAKDVLGEGERLSHAVGCAFSACLEAKKQRDALCSVEANFHNKNKSVFEKQGTFREQKPETQLTSKEGVKKEPLSKRTYGVVKHAIPEDEEWTENPTPAGDADSRVATSSEIPKPESAIERRHAPAAMLQRMQSMKEFSKLNSKHDLPFSDRSKRQNMSMQLKHSVSATEGLGMSTTTGSEVMGTNSRTLPKQQSLCIEDSRVSSQDSTNAAYRSRYQNQPSHQLQASHAVNSFDDSFTTVPAVASNSSNIPISTSVPTFQPTVFNQRNSYAGVRSTNMGNQAPATSAGVADNPQSELSSTNPFFIFVSNEKTDPVKSEQTTTLSHQNNQVTSNATWVTAEMNNQSTYSQNNPFQSQQSSVYSL